MRASRSGVAVIVSGSERGRRSASDPRSSPRRAVQRSSSQPALLKPTGSSQIHTRRSWRQCPGAAWPLALSSDRLFSNSHQAVVRPHAPGRRVASVHVHAPVFARFTPGERVKPDNRDNAHLTCK
jgi:hypothetical protein